MRFTHWVALTAVVVTSRHTTAQQPPLESDARFAVAQAGLSAAQASLAQQEELIVKTVKLHHLGSGSAAQLLTPYVKSPHGGVFEAPGQTVTIRETQKNLNDLLAVLAQYDRDPANVTLNFQLIAAENTNKRDPNLAGLDSLLRGVLKYSGYRLLTTALSNVSEFGEASQVLSGDGDPFTLRVSIAEVQTGATPADGTIRLHVALQRDPTSSRNGVAGHPMTPVLSTTLTVPIGQTVVLGTSSIDGGDRALILTVRPQIPATKR
ncbi:MAG: hypothetical protein ABI442_10995 [Gemmatimonadaceae bacterium]